MSQPAIAVPRTTATTTWVLAALAVAAVAVGLVLWPYAIDVLHAVDQPARGRTAGRLLVVVVGWSFVLAGLADWHSRPTRRLGVIMVLAGATWLLATVRATEVPLLWTVGQIIDVAALAVVAYALLAHPDDRLTSWWHRAIVAAVGASVVTRPLGLLLGGPADGLNVLSVHEVPALQPGLELVTIGLVVVGLGALAAVLAVRWLRATRPARRVLAPVLLPGMAFAVAWTVYLLYQLYGFAAWGAFDPPTALFQVLLLVFIGSLIALPFTLAVVRARGQARRALAADLAADLTGPLDDNLQAALRRTLADDSVVLAFPVDDGTWRSADGAPVDVPAADDRHCAVTYLVSRGRHIGAVLHDPALLHDDVLLRSVTGVAALAAENQRLAVEVQARAAEVRASRARLVAAGDEVRRRIERDLHDGAQQQLLSAALALRAVQVRAVGEVPAQVQEALEEAARQIDAGLAELRELARGIHPPLLVAGGLGPALRALAARAAQPVTIVELPEGRVPGPVEAAAYFLICECLANAAKHARARHVRVAVRRDGDALVVVVTDDGCGGAAFVDGGGLAGLVDRVDALGGVIALSSPAGAGTTVTARLPAPPPPRQPHG